MQSLKKWTCALSLFTSSVFGAEYEIDDHWSVLLEYVLLRRADISDRNLVKNSAVLHCDKGCRTHTVMDTNDLVNEFWFNSGGRIGLAYLPDTKSIYEASFMTAWPWESNEVRHADDTLYFPFHSTSFTEDYVNAETARAKYHTFFYTLELNYWRNVCRRFEDYFVFSGIFGVRFFELREKFTLAYYNTTDVLTGVDKSNYDAKSRNDLIGMQIGGVFQMNPIKYFSIEFAAKGGLGLNRAQAKVFLGDVNNTVTVRDYDKERWQSGVFADVTGKIQSRVVSNLDLHVGYEMLYVSGLALAPEQVSYSSNASNERFITSGFVIIHGVLIGMNVNF